MRSETRVVFLSCCAACRRPFSSARASSDSETAAAEWPGLGARAGLGAGAGLVVDGPNGQQKDARQETEEQPGLTIEELAESESWEEASRAGSQAGDLPPATNALLPASSAKQPLKWRQTTPVNTAMMFVPQQEAWYSNFTLTRRRNCIFYQSEKEKI